MASSSSGSSGYQPSPAPSTAPSTMSTDTSTSAANAAPGAERAPDDTSKLKTFLSILRKFIGVSDIASVRFSLPAQLLEPTPNLEYWTYLDRPETFISIGDSDDALGRMLAVLRFWFTKDLKYVKGKPCKPYNSTLGEFFRCNWEIDESAPPVLGSSQTTITPVQPASKRPIKISFLTEQTSHHPPVSAFWVDCPEKGISARGFDQLSAKFTGTSIRVTPGAHNLGIFIKLEKRDNEEYQLTHPAAHLGGLMRGSLSVSVADTCYVTCPRTKLKTILHYLDEGWLGKTQNRVVGVIYRYDPDTDRIARIKDVSEKEIVCRLEGCWQDEINYIITGSKESVRLVDLKPLFPVPKIVPPESEQLPNESRRFWSSVTQAILNKQYTQATKLKTELEERQREKAAARKAANEEWKPRFFTGSVTPVGKPDLTNDGILVLKKMQEGDFRLEESAITGA